MALLEILRGDYVDEEFKSELSGQDRYTESIQRHLTRLLNARRDAVPHLSEYGLPDLGEIYFNLPYSLDSLVSEVARCIERFEPRLRNVVVKVDQNNDVGCVINLSIQGDTVRGTPIRLHTWFSSEGRAEVK